MSEFTGIPQVDSLFRTAEETRDDAGRRTRKIFLLDADRYLFDFNLDRGEWQEMDTEEDASYFGVWVNKEKLRILQYLEGDVIFTQCDDAAGYDAEIATLCGAYEAAPGFVTIDDESVTAYYQDRNEFYVHPPEKSTPDGRTS